MCSRDAGGGASRRVGRSAVTRGYGGPREGGPQPRSRSRQPLRAASPRRWARGPPLSRLPLSLHTHILELFELLVCLGNGPERGGGWVGTLSKPLSPSHGGSERRGRPCAPSALPSPGSHHRSSPRRHAATSTSAPPRTGMLAHTRAHNDNVSSPCTTCSSPVDVILATSPLPQVGSDFESPRRLPRRIEA